VNDPANNGGGNGACGPTVVIVRDSDRSYSVTDGDKSREYSLPSESCDKVKLYGQDDTATPYEDLRLPAEDQAVLSTVGAVVSEGVSEDDEEDDEENDEESESSNSGSGSSSSGSGSLRREQVVDSVVNGSTFPVDEATGRPVIAFSERGIPVDPGNPTNWGSGAGAIYLTDGQDTVYAAVVQPMGGIKIRKYDASAAEWR
jgi:hypothetical protein